MSTGKISEMKSNIVLWNDRDYFVINYSEYFDGGHFVQLPYGISTGTIISISVTMPASIYVLTQNIRDGNFPVSLPNAGWKPIGGLIEHSNRRLENVFLKVIKDNHKTISLPATIGEGGTTIVILAKQYCSGTEIFYIFDISPY